MTAVEFFVPTLGGRSLSSNASGAKRHPHAIKEAKDALGEASYFTAKSALGPDIQFLRAPVDVSLIYHICYRKRPGDGLYRFRDPSNGGGDVAKVIIDYGLVKSGVLHDDDYRYVRVFSCAINAVETLAEEGVLVRAAEVEAR